MLRVLRTIEQIIIVMLILLMLVVVALGTFELARLIVTDVLSPPLVLLKIDEFLDIFGFFLLVLIGVELLSTLRAYLSDHVLHAEVVVEVAVIAIARKVIILDLKEHSAFTLVGIAAIILALTAAYYVIKRGAARTGDGGADAATRNHGA